MANPRFVCICNGNIFLGALPWAMGRLAPDPAVGVCEYIKGFQALCKSHGSWDLTHLLQMQRNSTGWKKAPCAELLGGKMAFLMKEFLNFSPSCCFADSKIKQALSKMQTSDQRLNFTKKQDADWYDDVSNHIRICAAQYRSLKSPKTKETLFRKCSPQEKEIIKEVVSLVQISGEEEARQPSTKADERQDDAPKDASTLGVLSFRKSIFKKVLSRNESDSSEGHKEMASSNMVRTSKVSTEQTSMSLVVERSAELCLDEDEKKLLRE